LIFLGLSHSSDTFLHLDILPVGRTLANTCHAFQSTALT